MNETLEKIKKLDVGDVESNVSLKKYTTYCSGGVAACVVYPESSNDLVKLISFLNEENIKYKIIGNGSNLLFSDKFYDGVLIRLTKLNRVKFLSNNKVRVGAGYSLIKLCNSVAKKGLSGLEFASGIPGTVGGAVFMNAGAYKSDMGYVVERVKVLTPDLKVIYLENKEMNFQLSMIIDFI